jgi:predicted AAA+ superfamily ATPase
MVASKGVTWTVEPMTSYCRRIVDGELDELLPALPAVALEGAKGVGKTATARQRAATVVMLDDPATFDLTEADPGRLLSGTPPVLIDEWQRLPQTWDLVRRAVDDSPAPGRFLLTGSASLKTPPTHSGAGRIVQVQMRPMSLAERGMEPSVSLADLLSGARGPVEGHTTVTLDDYVTEIVTGGFPALRGLPDRALRTAFDSYLARVVDRDFPEMGLVVRRPDALTRWMRAYAAATSTTASYDTIRDAATSGEGDKPAKTTTGPYRDTLERLWLADPIPAWLPTLNHLKRLAATPKHNLADPALAARLLGVGPGALLGGDKVGPPIPRDGTLLGGLFESLNALNVRVYAQAAEARVHHLRTWRGEHEVDLVVVRGDGRVVALEAKLAATVSDGDVRHLHWLRDQIGDDLLDAVVLTTGSDAYRRRDGIAVVPAALLGP